MLGFVVPCWEAVDEIRGRQFDWPVFLCRSSVGAARDVVSGSELVVLDDVDETRLHRATIERQEVALTLRLPLRNVERSERVGTRLPAVECRRNTTIFNHQTCAVRRLLTRPRLHVASLEYFAKLWLKKRTLRRSLRPRSEHSGTSSAAERYWFLIV